jgi:hypothetical protein
MIVTIAMTSGGGDWIAAALMLVVAALGARGFIRWRGTTLAAPAAWVVAAALVLTAVELALAWRPDLAESFGASLARYASAVGTFCPIMGVLGAKRPQDRGWPWVVLTRWIVLLVPAGQAWVGRTGRLGSVGPAWQLMLCGLTAIELLNYLPTRQAFPALLFATGQQALLYGFLIARDAPDNSLNRVVGSGLCLLAAMFVRPLRDEQRSRAASPLSSFNQRWLAFRDGWGAFWALRVMGRVNESAELSGWAVRLTWRGFTPTDGTAPPEIDERIAVQIAQAMDSLLRRFERVDGASPGD